MIGRNGEINSVYGIAPLAVGRFFFVFPFSFFFLLHFFMTNNQDHKKISLRLVIFHSEKTSHRTSTFIVQQLTNCTEKEQLTTIPRTL